MKHFCFLLLLLFSGLAQAQLRDDFADGNFTANPVWTGDAPSFQVNPQLQLQSNGPAATGTPLALSTPCRASTGTVWEFWANLRLATSAANRADVWLLASQADLKNPANTGYFVRLGGPDDEVSLFRKDSTRAAVAVIDGQNGTLASATNNLVRVRVTRTTADRWTLERDLTGGRTFGAEAAQPTDATYQRSVAVGVALLYSAANGRSFYFDDFAVTDATAPLLLRAVARDARQLDAVFNEAVAPASAALPASYRLQSGAAPVSAQVLASNPAVVRLTFGADLVGAQVLEARGVADLYGNGTAGPLMAAFAVPDAAGPADVVLNEILFNPRVGGVRFVEVLNRSTKFVDLRGWQLVSIRPDGSLDAVGLGVGPLVLPPGELRAFSANSGTLLAQYPTGSDAANLVQLARFPVFADVGTALLLDSKGLEIDRFAYNKNLHLTLLSTLEGVSLERIRANGPSTGSNFHSAAGAVGYATPGRPNSQAQDAPGGNQELTVEPEVFTPDDDGQQDFTTLSYHLDAPGYAATVTVYDALGRLTRRLVRNETLPVTGLVQWDGLDDRGHKAAVGYYILLVELFRPSGGERREFKKTVVLGARF